MLYRGGMLSNGITSSALNLLRKKNVTFGRRLSDDEAMSPTLPTVIADTFAVGTPLMRYLATIGAD